MNNRAILAASVALALIAPAAHADVRTGVDAWSRGDYATAVREWRDPAERGDPDALFNLAQAYKLGRGAERDLARAEDLFGKAAARGHMLAADNYGLLLFQRGEKARAMPNLAAAAGRGDPRAQYLLGLAHFNGDAVEKDWVRAYALVSLAQQSGLQQATTALAQMDQHIPLEQRQQSIALAARLASEAQATRQRQLAAADLGEGKAAAGGGTTAGSMSAPGVTHPSPIPRMPVIATAERELAAASALPVTPVSRGPAAAGADFTRGRQAATAARRPATAPSSAPEVVAAARDTGGTAAVPAPWRLQFGAFGVAGNADALWGKLRKRPELSGHTRMDAPAGRLTKLQAGGFASQAEAQAACRTLIAAGYTCVPVRN